MIRLRSNSIKSSGSFFRQVIGSNILFFCFVGVASAGLFYGWRYLDQHRQVMKEAKAKAAAIAAARPTVTAQTSVGNASNSVSAPNPVVASQPMPVSSPAVSTENNLPPQPAPVAELAAATTVASPTPQPKLPIPSEGRTMVAAVSSDSKNETHQTVALAPDQPAPMRLSDAIASVLTPSAKAMTAQPAVPPLPPTQRHAATSKTKTIAPAKPLTPEEQRLKIAQNGFQEVMSFAKNNRDVYGFRISENLEEAKIGEPIPVHLLTQPARATYQGQPVKSLLKPADAWFYPIVLHERNRYFVLVKRSGQEFVLGQGSRALAMAYEKIQDRWPASEGYHPQLILLPNLPFYYFNIPELPFENITDTSRMLDSNPEVSPASVQLGSWR